jgi:hypothetical protein
MNRTPLTNPQPKQRFQNSGDNVSRHRDMIDSTEFQRAADFGMLQYAAYLGSQVSDGNSAMAVGFQLKGAHDFLMTLRNISEAPALPARIPSSNLDHTV